jgi:drug/metabolite transporter (DMT)-like permease
MNLNFNTSRNQGVAMLIVAAASFGLNIPFAGLAGRMGLPGPDVVATRVIFLLIVIGTYIGLNKISLSIEPKDRKLVLALGLASALVGICYVSSIAFIPVGLAAMTFYTFPLVILVLSPLVEHVRLSGMIWIACALTVGGIGLAIGPSFSGLDWRGFVLAGGASLGAASQFFLAARAPGGGGVVLVFWLQLIMLPFALLTSWAFGGPAPLMTFHNAALPLAAATLGAAVGLIFQFIGTPRLGATAAGLIFCLEPIISTLFSGWLLGDILSLTQYLGATLVLCGIIVSLLNPVRQKTA